MEILSAREVRRLRLHAQRLDGVSGASTVLEVVQGLCAIQAQEFPSAVLAVRPRGDGLTAADVAHAQADDRSIVQTWSLRGTLHLTTAADLSWLLPLLGPVFIRKNARRYKQLGLTESIREQTFALLEDWAGVTVAPPPGETASPLPGGEAQTELARRYLRGYGPVTPHDFAALSGLGVRDSRVAFEALADELIEVQMDGSPLWLHKSLAGAPIDEPARVCLLPAYDPYLLGYKSRGLIVADEYAKRIHPGGGFIRPVLLVDGMAAGTWKLHPKGAAAVVTVEPFEPLTDDTRRALAGEVEDVGRFLQAEVSLRLT